jgi:hypothetical protein
VRLINPEYSRSPAHVEMSGITGVELRTAAGGGVVRWNRSAQTSIAAVLTR